MTWVAPMFQSVTMPWVSITTIAKSMELSNTARWRASSVTCGERLGLSGAASGAGDRAKACNWLSTT